MAQTEVSAKKPEPTVEDLSSSEEEESIEVEGGHATMFADAKTACSRKCRACWGHPVCQAILPVAGVLVTFIAGLYLARISLRCTLAGCDNIVPLLFSEQVTNDCLKGAHVYDAPCLDRWLFCGKI